MLLFQQTNLIFIALRKSLLPKTNQEEIRRLLHSHEIHLITFGNYRLRHCSTTTHLKINFRFAKRQTTSKRVVRRRREKNVLLQISEFFLIDHRFERLIVDGRIEQNFQHSFHVARNCKTKRLIETLLFRRRRDELSFSILIKCKRSN